jgi:antitoxin component YwqK of YwqJK toxin-antitoxin module
MKINGHYERGNYNGRWLYYNLVGDIIGTGNYVKGTGIQKAWYPNGNIMREINYVNNLKHGTEKLFNIDGKLEETLYYKEGKLID